MLRTHPRTVALACLLVSGACTRQIPSPKQIGGTYALNEPFGPDTLEIREDGTFEHRFTSQERVSSADPGRWQLDHATGQLTLTPWRSWRQAEYGEKYASYILLAEMAGNKPRLGLGPDEAIYYLPVAQ